MYNVNFNEETLSSKAFLNLDTILKQNKIEINFNNLSENSENFNLSTDLINENDKNVIEFYTPKSFEKMGRQLLISVLDYEELNPFSKVFSSEFKNVANARKFISTKLLNEDPRFKNKYQIQNLVKDINFVKDFIPLFEKFSQKNEAKLNNNANTLRGKEIINFENKIKINENSDKNVAKREYSIKSKTTKEYTINIIETPKNMNSKAVFKENKIEKTLEQNLLDNLSLANNDKPTLIGEISLKQKNYSQIKNKNNILNNEFRYKNDTLKKNSLISGENNNLLKFNNKSKFSVKQKNYIYSYNDNNISNSLMAPIMESGIGKLIENSFKYIPNQTSDSKLVSSQNKNNNEKNKNNKLNTKKIRSLKNLPMIKILANNEITENKNKHTRDHLMLKIKNLYKK